MMYFQTFMHETLSQFVRRIMNEKRISSYEIERRSNKRITQSHANRIKNGEIANPGPERLKALAVGLDVPESELFAVVRGMNGAKKANDLLPIFAFMALGSAFGPDL